MTEQERTRIAGEMMAVADALRQVRLQTIRLLRDQPAITLTDEVVSIINHGLTVAQSLEALAARVGELPST